MNFTTRNQQHTEYEQTIYPQLQQLGFTVHDLTYHTHLPTHVHQQLISLQNPTALLIRTRADRFILHNTLPIITKLEIKTSALYNAFAIEAFPLATHTIETTTTHAQCLYICKHLPTNHEFCFWIHTITPHIKTILIPPRWHTFTQQHQHWLVTAFPHAKLIYTHTHTKGSNTPYTTIPIATIQQLPHWKTTLQKLVQQHQPHNPQQPQLF